MKRQKTYTVTCTGTVTWTVEDFLPSEEGWDEAEKKFEAFNPTKDDVLECAGHLYSTTYDWDKCTVHDPDGKEVE